MPQAQPAGESLQKTIKPNHCILIALGANLASTPFVTANNLHRALAFLKESGAVIRDLSPFYHTPAFPAGAGPDFVNAAARIEMAGTPQEILAVLHQAEDALGRTREVRWGARTIDIDLIAMDDAVLPDRDVHAMWRNLPLQEQMERAPDTLVLPHPRLQDRAFVLVPLADIAPNWRHPLLGKTVRQMKEALPPADLEAVKVME